jgi:hypothetical protein
VRGEEDDFRRHHYRLAHRGDCGCSVLHRSVGDYLIQVRCDDELAYLAGAGDLDYDCDRFILKQCDSYSMPILCYFYCIILYTSYILYTALYYV